MANLIALRSIPATGRATESAARKSSTQQGSYLMIRPNGTLMGRVVTEAAASAIMAANMVTLPSGKRQSTIAIQYQF